MSKASEERRDVRRSLRRAGQLRRGNFGRRAVRITAAGVAACARCPSAGDRARRALRVARTVPAVGGSSASRSCTSAPMSSCRISPDGVASECRRCLTVRVFHAGARLALRSPVAVHGSHRSPQEAPDLCPRGRRVTCGLSTRCNKHSRCCASSRSVGRWWRHTKQTPRCAPSRSMPSSSRCARCGYSEPASSSAA